VAFAGPNPQPRRNRIGDPDDDSIRRPIAAPRARGGALRCASRGSARLPAMASTPLLVLARTASLLVVLLLLAATSWAASGWYLLIPPRSEYNERAEYLGAYKILDSKPLSQWGQQGAYDSASECEAVRNTLLMTEHRVYVNASEEYRKAVGAGADLVVLKMQRFITESDNANVSAFMASRCIRSDDPRLGR
jgi:hypothetical protein